MNFLLLRLTIPRRYDIGNKLSVCLSVKEAVYFCFVLNQSSGSYIYGVKIAVFLISIINDTYDS